MNRTFSLCLAAVLVAGSALAQTAQPAPQPPPKPKAGTIIDRPDSGTITSEPSATPAPATALPGTPAAGQRIERFEAVGNVSVASDTIRVYLGVNPGEPYDAAALQRNFLNLWQTGLFDDIRIETDNAPSGGVIVRAVVKERPRIGAVEYRGNKELNAAKITEQLDKDKIDLHVGNTLEQTLVRRAAESIKKAYSEGGFEGVTVDTTLEDMGGSDKKIVFNVSEGIKATVARIVFTGNEHFSSRRLKKQMKEVKENNIVTWIRKKNLYIPSKLDEDLEHVKNYYQDYGYTNVAFGEPQLTTIGTAKKPRVRITIPIKEGTIHRLGDVTVTGTTVFKPEAFTGNFPVKKGDVIRRKPIQDRVDALDELYRMRGFIYSYINPEYVERDNNIVDVHFAVFEGEQFRLGRLEFQGNTTTKDKVLRREIFLEEGEIMDMETFKQSIYKLGQLGYFKVNDNPDFKVNQEKKSVDVTVKGTEEGKNDVQFGGGYSEGTGFFVQTQFSTRNFLGEGENLGLSFQRGNRQNFYSLSYADPWFMDTPNSFGVSLFNRNTDFPLSVGYQERSRGGSVAYGYRLHRFDSLSLVYGLEHVRTHEESNVLPDVNGNVPISDISDLTYTSSSIGPSYSFDSRDNPFDTTRGGRVSAGLTFSGGPLGGTIHAIRPTFAATKFFKLSRKSSFSLNVDLGYLRPLDYGKGCALTYDDYVDQNSKLCVPKGQRFFVGGEYSVRGFEYGTLGPTEKFGGVEQIAGGYKQVFFNSEYIYRINDPLRLVFFADGGWAYGYNDKLDPRKLRYSTGAELRIFLPVFQFPIRFIYAINPASKPGDKFKTFNFTIGNTY
ncbi:MAG: outer membrane protein assembly factor BamA [Acidobacteria bacterium]|nr:outer membrane protein assembly factor BamA [Acidobacteriota bacterium]MBV9071540.1 outer membrane protein assembly factor BamA [Acidobacteriota bacterium]MBV9187793.1 outer membrane protein assembly factor BamA [Acidobacteriota bacterium]